MDVPLTVCRIRVFSSASTKVSEQVASHFVKTLFLLTFYVWMAELIVLNVGNPGEVCVSTGGLVRFPNSLQDFLENVENLCQLSCELCEKLFLFDVALHSAL